MDKSRKEEQQMTFHAANPDVETHHITRAGCTVSELLEDSGNRRQIINQELSLHPLSDSLFSEQQKLRDVLDWARSFLSSDSEDHHEFCRAASVILANEEQKQTQKISPVCEHPSAVKCHHPVSCTAGGHELFGGEGGSMQKVWRLEPSNYESSESNNHLCAYEPPFSDDPCIPLSFISGRDEVTLPEYREMPENVKRMKLQNATDKQTPCQDYTCTTSGLFISNQRQRIYLSDRNTNRMLASDGATGLIKESTSCWSNTHHKESMAVGTASNLKLSYKTAQSERDMSGDQMELSKVKAEEKVGIKKEVLRMSEGKGKVNEDQDSSSAIVVYAKNNIRNSESEKTQGQIGKISNLSFSCHLKIPPYLTVYEQYQLCVDRLHHLRMRQSQHTEPGCFIVSPAKERKASEEVAAPTPAPTAAEITKERRSGIINKNQGASKYNRNKATFTEQGHAKYCDNLTVKETPAAICAESRPVCPRNTSNSNKCGELIKSTAGIIISTDRLLNTSMDHPGTASGDNVPSVEGTAALTPNPGLFPKRSGCSPGVKGCQSRLKGQRKKGGGRGASLRLCEKSRVSLSSLTNKEISQSRLQSAGVNKKTRHPPGDNVKPTPAYRDTHKCLQPTETHILPHDDPGPTSTASGACRYEQTDCKYSPAGVPACDRWLCLPDEVWLSILSLLSHSDLCRLLQVCSRLHTLASDHTLWKDLRIENSNVTERWLLCVSRRRPRSLCLYSCSGLSLTSCGLEMFFTLCRKNLEELKVTSCTGPGLHGDQMLSLIGQLCDHVTSVDVSWSGATDTGVKALSDCCAGLQLKSVVLNGCHVTDDPLMKLVTRHKESLCRLEVFGCQFLTPSCLQTVYEMCTDLEHLNIGQLPKVNAHSLTAMASQLKCLISLNLTGLQAVTDATVDTLLQNCVKLQSLTFSSCPGVTDLTLHSISKYTPFIKSLDVSGCKAVTDAGLQSLAMGCRRLQQLDLSSTGTGNRGVTLLANYCSRHLHTVKLSFCRITPENMLKLCRRCQRLKVLHLYGCTHLPTEREIREVNTAVKVYPLP